MNAIIASPVRLLIAAASLCVSLTALAAPKQDAFVVVISVDGMPAEYGTTPNVDMPTLRRMAASGARAEGMLSVPPLVTWPNHTTLVTGVSPDRHGIIGNAYYDRDARKEVDFIWDPVFDKEDSVKVPTVYDVVHQAGLKTAGIAWPGARNARHLDWQVPCVMDAKLLERYTTPELLPAFARLGITPDKKPEWSKIDGLGKLLWDWMHTQIAKQVIAEKRPNLLFLHFDGVDALHHRNGRDTPEAYWAAHSADRFIADIVGAVEAAGLSEKTTFFIVSDHGFRNYTNQINLIALLRNAKLVETAGNRIVKERVHLITMGGGGGASLYIVDREDREAILQDLVQRAKSCEGIESVIATDVAALAQDPRLPDLVLVSAEGYGFTKRVPTIEVITPMTGMKGAHGQTPGAPALDGTFVAFGAAIKPGVKLPKIRNVDVAPTIAAVLGVEMQNVEGRVLQEILR